jgi:cysteine desulfurase / selenocysteine lyase
MLINDKLRLQFPILSGNKDVYFDNAATIHKPESVIKAIIEYYGRYNSNVHRGIHKLSEKSTDIYEEARIAVAKFINAEPNEIIFTARATEGLNLVASSFCNLFINPKAAGGLSFIITSEMEHHSNIVPFQKHCDKSPMDSMAYLEIDKQTGRIDIDNLLYSLQQDHKVVKFITITHVSNALGVVNDIKTIINAAHSYNIPVIIDGAQAIAHMKVDVKDMDCDFYAFSGHKMYAPMGIGVLFGKNAHLSHPDMPPFQYGGGMVEHVEEYKAIFQDSPYKFEAGTPNVEGAYGLHRAIDFINEIGIDNIEKHERELMQYAILKLKQISKVKIIGEPEIGSISFIVDGHTPNEVAEILNANNIAVRSGFHCTHILMHKLGLGDTGTVRASFACYNTKAEIDWMAKVLEHLK